jgi:hypothetical protein
LFAPDPDVWLIEHVWVYAPLVVVEACSVQVAVLELDDDTCTIVHVCDESSLAGVAVPPPCALQTNELPPPAVAIWSTRVAFVHVQPLPGQ